MTWRPHIAAGIVCLLLLGTSAARAGEPELIPRPKNPRVLRLLDEGFRFYEAGDFEKALDVYKRAARISPGPLLHYNMGQCYRRLRKYRLALFHYERVLEDSRVAEEVLVNVREFIRDMKAELSKAASSKPPTGPAESLETNSPESRPMVTERARPPWYADRVGLALTGGGVGLAALGIAFYVHGSALRTRSNGEPDFQKREGLKASARSWKLWGTVLGITGAAALTVGVIKLLRRGDRATDTKRSARITLGPGSIFVSGRF